MMKKKSNGLIWVAHFNTTVQRTRKIW